MRKRQRESLDLLVYSPAASSGPLGQDPGRQPSRHLLWEHLLPSVCITLRWNSGARAKNQTQALLGCGIWTSEQLCHILVSKVKTFWDLQEYAKCTVSKIQKHQGACSVFWIVDNQFFLLLFHPGTLFHKIIES